MAAMEAIGRPMRRPAEIIASFPLGAEALFHLLPSPGSAPRGSFISQRFFSGWPIPTSLPSARLRPDDDRLHNLRSRRRCGR